MARQRVDHHSVPGPPQLRIADGRERTRGFKRLDRDAQDLVRERWAQDERDWDTVNRMSLARLQRGLLEGVAVFGAVELVLTVSSGLNPVSLMAAIAWGAFVGLGWAALDSGLVFSLLSAASTYFLLLTLFSSHVGDLLVGPVLIALPAAYLGWRRTLGPTG